MHQQLANYSTPQKTSTIWGNRQLWVARVGNAKNLVCSIDGKPFLKACTSGRRGNKYRTKRDHDGN